MSYNPNLHHRRSIRLKGYDYLQAGAYFITICCHNRKCLFGEITVGAAVGAGASPAPTALMTLNEFGQIAYNEWIKLTERFENFELDVFQIMPNHIHGIIVLNNVGATLALTQNDGNNQTVIGAMGATLALTQNDGNNQTDIGAMDATLALTQNDENNQTDIGAVGTTLTVTQNDGNNQTDIGADIVSNIRAGASPAPTNATVSDILGAYKSLVANGCLEIYKSKNETMGKLWQRNYHEHIIRNEQSYKTISNYIINNPAKWNVDKFYIQ